MSEQKQEQSESGQSQQQGPIVPKLGGTEMEIADQSDNTPKEEKKE